MASVAPHPASLGVGTDEYVVGITNPASIKSKQQIHSQTFKHTTLKQTQALNSSQSSPQAEFAANMIQLNGDGQIVRIGEEARKLLFLPDDQDVSNLDYADIVAAHDWERITDAFSMYNSGHTQQNITHGIHRNGSFRFVSAQVASCTVNSKSSDPRTRFTYFMKLEPTTPPIQTSLLTQCIAFCTQPKVLLVGAVGASLFALLKASGNLRKRR